MGVGSARAALEAVRGIEFEFTVAGDAGVKLDRDCFRPCNSLSDSLCFVDGCGGGLCEMLSWDSLGPEGEGRRVTKRPLKNIVSTGF
jgi:hypothetical protein